MRRPLGLSAGATRAAPALQDQDLRFSQRQPSSFPRPCAALLGGFSRPSYLHSLRAPVAGTRYPFRVSADGSVCIILSPLEHRCTSSGSIPELPSVLARAAFRPIHRWPLAPSVGRRACESRSSPGSSVLRRLVCLAAAAGVSPHGPPPRPFRTRQFYRAVLDGSRRRHTSLPQRAPSALLTSARQARHRASMTSARVMRAIVSRACFPARRDLV